MRASVMFLVLLLSLPAAAQERQIRVISGFAAGGTSDLISRLLAEAVAAPLAARVVVENRTGANGTIAAELVARSAPDGNTVFQCPMGTLTISPQLLGATLPIDPGEALAPIALVALSSYGLVVAANGPHADVASLLAAARIPGAQVTFASAGVGSAQHLSGELLRQRTGAPLVHVPYRGAAPAIIDILGGRADFMITNLADATAQIRDGALRLLALADNGGSPLYPGIASLSRTVPGFDVAGWFGICGPRGMSAAVAAQWETAIGNAVAEPRFAARLTEIGLTPRFETAVAFARRIAADRARWGTVIRAVGIRAE
jgi:tripartite-type tricarboxylate transporter receptor subunit TctC